ncbi:MAG: phosphoribosylamine--glycine ligase [Silanimonas sp.]|nr:MAG: phosphoribosylamine--glycine ligase [Silanimonas sp.]
MKVLVIGNGGREHALAWKLAQSPRVSEVLVAPGNAGTAAEPKCRNVDVKAIDLEGLLALAQREGVALTVVGPEAPLVAGVVDRFRAAGQRIFGPTAKAAQLEGSKAFAKAFLKRHGIPTAGYEVFTEVEAACAYIRARTTELNDPRIVVKADGLAAGKGVIVAASVAEAEAAVRDMLAGNAFGSAGARVVIEDFLEGEEASFISMVDGMHALPMATSQDHKRVGDGDTGPNTGGMGAYSPAPVVTPEVHARVMREIVDPTVRGMAADGIPFTGFLYAGLMIDAQGAPRVIEFNVRFGDPETQPVMLRLDSDLVDLLEAAIDGRLDTVQARWSAEAALGVVMAARPYPETPITGDVIHGLDAVPAFAKVFHAGTVRDDEGVKTSGGRVLCVCARGAGIAEAQRRAYEAVAKIHWANERHRNDIGWRAVAREQG